MELTDKINKNNEYLNDLLNKTIQVKLICFLKEKILLDKNFYLPFIEIIKKDLTLDLLQQKISHLLNVNITNLKVVPFSIYQNYQERYYYFNFSLDDVMSLDEKYSFYDIDSLKSIDEKNIILNLIRRWRYES